MSLVEVMIALGVISVALLAIVSLMISSGRVQDDSRERTIAYNAARRVVEEMRATAFAEIYARYNASTADNPSGTCPGATFTVDDIPKGPGGSAQGMILFPEANAGAGLSESPANAILSAEFGMPKDLNRDGDTSDTALTIYYILPVKVRVQWLVPSGKVSSIDVVTFISER